MFKLLWHFFSQRKSQQNPIYVLQTFPIPLRNKKTTPYRFTFTLTRYEKHTKMQKAHISYKQSSNITNLMALLLQLNILLIFSADSSFLTATVSILFYTQTHNRKFHWNYFIPHTKCFDWTDNSCQEMFACDRQRVV